MVTVLWGCFHGDPKWYKNGRWEFVFETYGQQHGCSWTCQIQHTAKMVVEIPASTTNPFGDHLHLAIPTWPSIQAPRQHLQHILQSSLQPSLQAPIPQEAHPSLHPFSGQKFKSFRQQLFYSLRLSWPFLIQFHIPQKNSLCEFPKQATIFSVCVFGSLKTMFISICPKTRFCAL